MYGEAYDMPGTLRAYSYKHQPGNQKAWRLGEALRKAAKMPTGDYIDTGLNLLKALEDSGFGVFELAAFGEQGGK